MKSLLTCVLMWLCGCTPALAQTVLVNQTPVSGGGVSRSSQLWQDPGPNGNDLDSDAVCWADFTLTSAATIDHMEWWGTGACELGFRIEFWRQDPNTIAYQPLGVFYYGGDHTVQPERRFDTTSYTTTAGPGGISHYSLDLTSPVTLAANDASNVRWFVAIIGLTHQAYVPWNWAQGTGGTGHTYQFVRGLHTFRSLGEGRALLLRAAGGATVTIAATANPASAGTTTGAGSYAPGSLAVLHATPNAGWGFFDWTEGTTHLTSSRTYSFTVSGPRTLRANFVPAYTISTSVFPQGAGTTTGDGVYNTGTSVTVTASPTFGYIFSEWTEQGFPVSNDPTYTFSATGTTTLVANFVPDPSLVLFDFDNAQVHMSLPQSITVNGLTANLSATGGGFSIQPANSLGFTPVGFGGLCVYPNSVFAADLLVSFSSPITSFSILYSPAENGCDNSATMRVTALSAGVEVGTATTTAPQPGTWPTGTLSIDLATPFDSVVVHYDSRPPTCQDWGPIFLADDMRVLLAPVRCVADVDDGTFSGTPDGGVTIDDLLYYLFIFESGILAADVDDGTGTGTLDGGVTIDDLLYYLQRFEAGC